MNNAGEVVVAIRMEKRRTRVIVGFTAQTTVLILQTQQYHKNKREREILQHTKDEFVLVSSVLSGRSPAMPHFTSVSHSISTTVPRFSRLR